MSFVFKRLEIPDVILIEPECLQDKRGFFMETYKYPDFSKAGIAEQFLQDSHSQNLKREVLRGFHYQKEPMAQAKIIRVIKGEIFDVALDIRKGSCFYGKCVTMLLSAENRKMIYMPKGFAHAFCAISDESEIIYKFSNVYSKEFERGIIWNDPQVGLNWPVKAPIISERDAKFPTLDKADNNFVYAKE